MLPFASDKGPVRTPTSSRQPASRTSAGRVSLVGQIEGRPGGHRARMDADVNITLGLPDLEHSDPYPCIVGCPARAVIVAVWLPDQHDR